MCFSAELKTFSDELCFFFRRIEDLQFQIEEEVISKDDLEVSCLSDHEPCLNLNLLFLLGAKYT